MVGNWDKQLREQLPEDPELTLEKEIMDGAQCSDTVAKIPQEERPEAERHMMLKVGVCRCCGNQNKPKQCQAYEKRRKYCIGFHHFVSLQVPAEHAQHGQRG